MEPPTDTELVAILDLSIGNVLSTRTAVLLTLLGCDYQSCRVGPLAQRLRLKLTQLSMACSAMERAGLVMRCCPIDDLRLKNVVLTAKGRQKGLEQLGLLRALAGTSSGG